MIVVKTLTANQIVAINKLICEQAGNPHVCHDPGKIESALHTAFYPGAYPYAAGGIAKLAAALCYYIVKDHAFADGNKRTGALAAITLMNLNGWKLHYPLDPKANINDLARVIEATASSEMSKEELMDWFDQHKVDMEDL